MGTRNTSAIRANAMGTSSDQRQAPPLLDAAGLRRRLSEGEEATLRRRLRLNRLRDAIGAGALTAVTVLTLSHLFAAEPKATGKPGTQVTSVDRATYRRIQAAMKATEPTCRSQGRATSGWAEWNPKVEGGIEILTSCEGMLPGKG